MFRYRPVASVVRYSASFVLSTCRFFWFLETILSHRSRIKRQNRDILKAECWRPHLKNSFPTASVQSILNFPENHEDFVLSVCFFFPEIQLPLCLVSLYTFPDFESILCLSFEAFTIFIFFKQRFGDSPLQIPSPTHPESAP